MSKASREDRGTLRRPRKTPQGFLHVDGYASRVGIFEYRNPDGSVRRELRLPEDVFHADALAGFEGVSLTDGHPVEMVTTENAKRYEVGTVTGPAQRDDEHVVATIMVKDPRVIAKLERGDTGLSVGYSIDLDETPGTHPTWGRYDAIQRNLVINHLAVGVQPRAGNSARVRMDGASVQIDRSDAVGDSDLVNPEDLPMPDEIRTDAEEVKGLKLALETANKQIEALTGKLAARLDVDESAAVQKEKVRADAADAKLAEVQSGIPALVRARAKLEGIAGSVMGKAYRMDDLDDVQVHRAVVKRLDATIDTDKLGLTELRFALDQLVKLRDVARADYDDASQITGRDRTEQKRADEESVAAAKREDEYRNQWRKTVAPKEQSR